MFGGYGKITKTNHEAFIIFFCTYIFYDRFYNQGDLPMTITWIFHGQELSSQMGIETSKFGKRSNILSIESVAAMHRFESQMT